MILEMLLSTQLRSMQHLRMIPVDEQRFSPHFLMLILI